MARRSKISRIRCGLIFAVAGLTAGAVHIVEVAPESLRLWREVLPLTGVVGFILGAVVRPFGVRAGAITGVVALMIFALTYSLSETIVQAFQGKLLDATSWVNSIIEWTGIVISKMSIAAFAAILCGVIGGWLIQKSVPR